MIIPLGPGLLRDSSSLPKGSSKHSFECSHPGWASPPLLFDLAPRGVFRAPDVATRAVGSYPTFSPLPNVPTVRGAPQVLPAACRRGSSVTGGLFSVALSVAALQTCLRMPQTQPPGVTRRIALRRRLLRVHDDGVRTFLPSAALSSSEPAITRLTSQT